MDRRRGSLRNKITYGYYAVGTLFIGLAAYAFVELRQIEDTARISASITEFFDAVREVRNNERNLFLYRKQGDYREAAQNLAHAISLLDIHRPRFLEVAPPERIDGLRERLERYGIMLAGYWDLVRNRPLQARASEEDISLARNEILDETDQLSRQADRSRAAALERYRGMLIGSIVAAVLMVVGAGQFIARRIARPLKEMEEKMGSVAQGQLTKLELGEADKEIASLSAAFNHVLSELEARNREMVRAEKLASLGTMLSGVAHELNNPLSNISTSTQILLEELGQADLAYQRELLEQIDEQTDRARGIVRSLLDFAGERAFRREPQALRPLLEDTLRLFGRQLPVKVRVEVQVPEEIVIQADKPRMQQVFINLIRNAVDASPDGGTVRVSAARTDGREGSRRFRGPCEGRAGVDICVADEGQGIAPEVLPKIFDPFFTTKDANQGSGLGLFVVHEIVSEHGGCIAVESEPGRGTRFHLRLPEGAEAVAAP